MKINKKILIVDDEPDVAMILKLHLEDEGYSTDWAENGEKALHLMQENLYSLLLLDVRMPGLSGIELLEIIKKEGKDISVIMMTAHGSEYLAVECMKAGAADYVSKPFVMDDLLQRVDRSLKIYEMEAEKKRLERESDDFFSMLSHDLKNPITAAIGSIDLVKEERLGGVNSQQKDYLAAAIESCEEVVDMINNLLDVQRYDKGKMAANLKPINPVEIAEDAAEKFKAAAIRESIELTFIADSELNGISIYADRSILKRVIANLIGNSLKFTYENGSIIISVKKVAKAELQTLQIPKYLSRPEVFDNSDIFVRISVKDSGSGIPAEDLENIFAPYIQSTKRGREKGGAGLGLAFCKKAVESYNGLIWGESDGENGSEFIILIPAGDKA